MNKDENKWTWVIVGALGALLLVGLGGNFLLNKIADRVILKLQTEYSPSPYGPSIDPDKLDVEKLPKKNQ